MLEPAASFTKPGHARTVPAASSALAAQLVAQHFTPAVVADFLRAFAWWCAWRGHAAAVPTDIALIPTFLRVLLAAGATRYDIVTAVGVLNLLYPADANNPPLAPGKWSAAAPIRAIRAVDVAALRHYAELPGTQLAIVLFGDLGLRQHEAFALVAADIDWPGQRICVGQGPTCRWLGLTSGSAPAIARGLSVASSQLVANRSGAPLSRADFRADLAQASVKAGLGARGTPAALRHGYGASALRAGRDFRLLLARLGLPGANGEVPHLGPPPVARGGVPLSPAAGVSARPPSGSITNVPDNVLSWLDDSAVAQAV